MSNRELHFTAFIAPGGYHESAWRLVDAEPRAVLGLPYYAQLARIAERGRLDAMFAADNISIAEYRAEHMPQTLFDPVELMSALCGVTERIGLIATGSTTYSAPWDLARRFATLDHLSGGRAGWNIVTTRSVLTAANFGGSAHPSPAERYAHAAEFVEVVRRVWDSWEDGAVIGDRQAGVWADRARLHAPHFVGEHYQVAGILPFPRPPQGHPVLVQAGSSPAGVALAASCAELVFTRQPSVGDAVAFRRRLHEQVAAAGRRPEHVFVLPALAYTLAATEGEARARQAALEELASPEFRWQNMLWMIGLDPDGGFDPDAPLPAELLAGPPPSSGAERVFAAARREPIPNKTRTEPVDVVQYTICRDRLAARGGEDALGAAAGQRAREQLVRQRRVGIESPVGIKTDHPEHVLPAELRARELLERSLAGLRLALGCAERIRQRGQHEDMLGQPPGGRDLRVQPAAEGDRIADARLTVKTSSAQLAASATPAGEEPAWTSTGCPCGGRGKAGCRRPGSARRRSAAGADGRGRPRPRPGGRRPRLRPPTSPTRAARPRRTRLRARSARRPADGPTRRSWRRSGPSGS